MRDAGCGVREGVDADASTIIYGDFAQASVKSPFASKNHLTPWSGVVLPLHGTNEAD